MVDPQTYNGDIQQWPIHVFISVVLTTTQNHVFAWGLLGLGAPCWQHTVTSLGGALKRPHDKPAAAYRTAQPRLALHPVLCHIPSVSSEGFQNWAHAGTTGYSPSLLLLDISDPVRTQNQFLSLLLNGSYEVLFIE